jgi:Tol biopolymer transport system component
LLVALPVLAAGVVKIERVSPPALDLEVPLASGSPSMTPDGRYVAFVAEGDIYLRDRQSGQTELVSVTPGGEPANAASYGPSISADGRFVAFSSEATNLLPGEPSDQHDVFVRDLRNGTTERVSVASDGTPANGMSAAPSISADGRFVAFESYASDLAPGDTNSWEDIFVRDRESSTTVLASVAADGTTADNYSNFAKISSNGHCVVFQSRASNLVPGDTNGVVDLFVRDLRSGTTELASATASGEPVNRDCAYPSISADGRFIAFHSRATNVLPEDLDRTTHIYVRDRQSQTTQLVSVALDGRAGTMASYHPAISANGHFVAFQSYASNLVPGDTNGIEDIFVRDRETGTTQLVRVATAGQPANRNPTAQLCVSDDARFIAFGGGERIVLSDRSRATTEAVTATVNVGRAPLDGAAPVISGNGEWVAFALAGQVFARSRTTGAAELVSVSPEGAPANGASSAPAISADGRLIAFQSRADNLVPGDVNGFADIFVRDRQSGTTRLVSTAADGVPAAGISIAPAISADGHFIAFQSSAEYLVPGDRNSREDIFVRELETGTTEIVSVAASGGPADAGSSAPSISADGRFVAFQSSARELVPGDTNDNTDVFVRDRQSGTTRLVSAAADGGPANNDSTLARISADGHFIAFQSRASNFVPGDTGSGQDIFVRDLTRATTELISVTAEGRPGGKFSHTAAINRDGRFVAFQSYTSNVLPGVFYPGGNIYVRDRQTGVTEIVSVAANGGRANGYSYAPAISGSGLFVAFESKASNLTTEDRNEHQDVLLVERG